MQENTSRQADFRIKAMILYVTFVFSKMCFDEGIALRKFLSIFHVESISFLINLFLASIQYFSNFFICLREVNYKTVIEN